MDVSASSATYTSTSDRLSARLAAVRAQSGLSPTQTTSMPEATPSQADVLASANSALFQMARLVQEVRSLSSAANALQPSNTIGLDAIRNQVSAALSEISALALMNPNPTTPPTSTVSTSGTSIVSTSSESTQTKSAPLTLGQIRSTLADMQTNLRNNINKVGKGIRLALSYSGQSTTGSQAVPFLGMQTMSMQHVSLQAILANPKAAQWAYGHTSNSSTFTKSV